MDCLKEFSNSSKKPVLSICIPTFNRKDTLEVLLNSIVNQLILANREIIEITVSDNASTDGTEEFMKQYIARYKGINISYFRNKENLGAGANYLKAVEMAHGEYAWIIGSDDELYSDAIQRILVEIQMGATVYLAQRDNYDITLSKFIGKQLFFKELGGDNLTIPLNSRENWAFYLNLCTEIGGIMSYLSSIVFNKKLWDGVQPDNDYMVTEYIHTYNLFKVLLDNEETSIRLINKPFVKCRLGNDSFFQSAYQRLMLDLDGYIQISKVFKDPFLRQDFLLVLKKTYPLIPIKAILHLKKKEWKHLEDAMRVIGYTEMEIELVGRMQRHKILTLLLYEDRILKKLKRMIKRGKQE